jgi:hypothetical protein
MNATKQTEKFIGYTAGLECWVNDRLIMTKVEYVRIADGVVLRAVSGRDLSALPTFQVTLSEAAFVERPVSAVDKIPQALWALGKLGLKAAAND